MTEMTEMNELKDLYDLGPLSAVDLVDISHALQSRLALSVSKRKPEGYSWMTPNVCKSLLAKIANVLPAGLHEQAGLAVAVDVPKGGTDGG